MKVIEMTGKTVDEALKNALNELKLTKEEVDIEIIDEGSKGIFNLIGNKPARIKITKKKSAIDEVEKFLTDVLKYRYSAIRKGEEVPYEEIVLFCSSGYCDGDTIQNDTTL